MNRYKRILVTLDLSDKDTTTVNYAEMLGRLAESEKVYFCHVAKNFDLPEGLGDQYPELSEPVDEKILSQMKKTVDPSSRDFGRIQPTFEALEGHPLTELLRFIKRKSIDLVLVGKGKKLFSRSRLAEKLCRKAPCSVMVVPVNAPPRISRILVPIDFSDNSRQALDVAASIGARAGVAGIHSMNVFKLPTGYYKTGKSEEQFEKIMQKNALKTYDTFIRDIPLKGMSVEFSAVRSKHIEKAITEASEKMDSDLIVVGAQGRDSGAAILLGSVTENLIWTADAPVLAVKQKGAGMDILDAILKL